MLTLGLDFWKDLLWLVKILPSVLSLMLTSQALPDPALPINQSEILSTIFKKLLPINQSEILSTIFKKLLGSSLSWKKLWRQRNCKKSDWLFRRLGTRKDTENQIPGLIFYWRLEVSRTHFKNFTFPTGLCTSNWIKYIPSDCYCLVEMIFQSD